MAAFVAEAKNSLSLDDSFCQIFERQMTTTTTTILWYIVHKHRIIIIIASLTDEIYDLFTKFALKIYR
jgi:hypothetical protein